MKQQITEEILKAITWRDVSIQRQKNGKDLLVLICENKVGSTRLHEILSAHAYDLKVWKQANGNYGLSIEFIESGFVLELNTGKNETNYPPSKNLNKIAFVTTGVRVGKSTAAGSSFEVHSPVLRLVDLDIGESFKQAKEVQFIAGDKGKSPSAVVLIFRDYDHIHQAEADEAFNKLFSLSKSHPVLEISPNGGFIKLRIWDILVELDVTIEGLKYVPQQLTDFLNESDPQNSFAFALGFPPSGDVKAALASTSSEGLEIITIKGYEYTPEK